MANAGLQYIAFDPRDKFTTLMLCSIHKGKNEDKLRVCALFASMLNFLFNF